MWPYVNMQYSLWYERIVVLAIMILLGVVVITAIWLEESEPVPKQIPLEERVRVLEEKIEAYDRAMESQVRINQYMLDFQEQMVETRVLGLKRVE